MTRDELIALAKEAMSNADLIANLRGENLDCNCAAYSRSECCCSTNWPESFCEQAADALEEADRKLAIAVAALEIVVALPRSHEAHRRATQALAQIETDQ